MANPNKRKGTSCENEAVVVFRRFYPACERRAMRGKNDAGDVAGLPIPLECKANVADISDAIKEAEGQAKRLGDPGYAAFIHARGKPAERAYFVAHGWFGAELVAGWDWARRNGWEGSE